MTPLGRQIGESVKARRLELRLTQEQLAERLNIAPQFLGRIERGIGLPSVQTLVALAAELEVSVDALLGQEVEKSTDMDIGLMLEALSTGDVTKLTAADLGSETAGQLVGLVPKSLRERLQAEATIAVDRRREELVERIRRARPRTLALIAPIVDALEGAGVADPPRQEPHRRRR